MYLSMQAKKVCVYYGSKKALNDVSMDFPKGAVTALIGPSGCGKSTFLRCLNRMNDLIPVCRVEGEITLEGQDIMAKSMDVVDLRRKVGMVFQKPNPFPKSIFENVAYGLRVNGVRDEALIAGRVEEALRRGMENPALASVLGRMHFYRGDSIEELPRLDFVPDIVVLDPMFPERKKR